MGNNEVFSDIFHKFNGKILTEKIFQISFRNAFLTIYQ